MILFYIRDTLSDWLKGWNLKIITQEDIENGAIKKSTIDNWGSGSNWGSGWSWWGGPITYTPTGNEMWELIDWTIYCGWLVPWDTFDLDWKTYSVVRDSDVTNIENYGDRPKSESWYENICTSHVTNGSHIFSNRFNQFTSINPDVSHWDTSNFTTMEQKN